MSASPSGRIIDGVIADGIARWFRDAGFTRHGRSFFRHAGECVHTAHVQAFSQNRPGDASFAVNLGVEWLHWYRVWTGQEPPANPAAAPAFIQARLNPDHAPDDDHWWRADSKDPSDAGASVVAALQAHASTFWANHSDLERVLSLFDAGASVPTGILNRRLLHAALLVRAGRYDQARSTIAEAQRRAPGISRDVILRVAERLGLNSDEAR